MTEKEILTKVFVGHELTTEEMNKLHTHIEEYKYYLNEEIPFEVSWDQAIFAWYDNIFRIVRGHYINWAVKLCFPRLSLIEFYFHVIDRWHYIKNYSTEEVYIHTAISNYVKHFSERKFLGKVLYLFVRD